MSAENFMRLAIEQAKKAALIGEVPVGAVIVKDNSVIAFAHNQRQSSAQAHAHAEMLAMEKACSVLGDWRLCDCDLFVTMEPCPMCAGAILQARIHAVYYGCFDKVWGAFGTVTDISAFFRQNKPEIYGGILESSCAALLKEFFQKRRNNMY